MHANSQNKKPALLIASVTARSLAASARRAGFRPLVLDLFGDTDTLALAERAAPLPGSLDQGIDPDALIPALLDLAGDDRDATLILGSGFERETELVDEIATRFNLAGNDGATIRHVKDPTRLAADCARIGIPHPDLCWQAPADLSEWVVKTHGGAGGMHVSPARTDRLRPGQYFQRFIRGENISACFIADGRNARIAGFSRQWASPTAQAPFRYSGAVRLVEFDKALSAKIETWLCGLVQLSGLKGICSADFLQDGDEIHLIEINPRPGATLDIFDDEEAPLIQAHIDASAGRAFRLPRYQGSMASTIVYAEQDVPSFPDFSWPDWSADHQPAGTSLTLGDPVCTIFATGHDALEAHRTLMERNRDIHSNWEG